MWPGRSRSCGWWPGLETERAAAVRRTVLVVALGALPDDEIDPEDEVDERNDRQQVEPAGLVKIMEPLDPHEDTGDTGNDREDRVCDRGAIVVVNAEDPADDTEDDPDPDDPNDPVPAPDAAVRGEDLAEVH